MNAIGCPLLGAGSGTSHQSVMEIRDAVREERPCRCGTLPPSKPFLAATFQTALA